jgi:hypothetical protein
MDLHPSPEIQEQITVNLEKAIVAADVDLLHREREVWRKLRLVAPGLVKELKEIEVLKEKLFQAGARINLHRMLDQDEKKSTGIKL